MNHINNYNNNNDNDNFKQIIQLNIAFLVIHMVCTND